MDSIRLSSALHIFSFFWLTVSLRCVGSVPQHFNIADAIPCLALILHLLFTFTLFLEQILAIQTLLEGGTKCLQIFRFAQTLQLAEKSKKHNGPSGLFGTVAE